MNLLFIYILRYVINAGVYLLLKGGVPLDIPWGLYSGNFTRRDHPGNLGRVFGSSPVNRSTIRACPRIIGVVSFHIWSWAVLQLYVIIIIYNLFLFVQNN